MTPEYGWAIDPTGESPCYRRAHVTARALMDAVSRAMPDAPVTCEMTGGGCATIYVGDYSAERGPVLAIGPGRYDYRAADLSTFVIGPDGEASIGPDDDAGSPVLHVRDITTYLAEAH